MDDNADRGGYVDLLRHQTTLARFGELALRSNWGKKYPAIGQGWHRAWGEVVPFYAFPGAVRRICGRRMRIMAPRERSMAELPLAILFGQRFTTAMASLLEPTSRAKFLTVLR